MFVTFEGPEGAGKSTQAQALADALRQVGYPVVLVHEPGATPIGEAIRTLLLAPDRGRPLSPRTEALLFAAARAQLVDEVIRPRLNQGDVVICDRFSDSTVAYQAGGRGLDSGKIAALIEFATDGLRPDVTFLLDLDVRAGLGRKGSGGLDRLEQEAVDFHERVRSAYLQLAANEPKRVVRLEATDPFSALADNIRSIVVDRLTNTSGLIEKTVLDLASDR